MNIAQRKRESIMSDYIDPVTEFAAWLTTRETVIKVGASETVYAMWEALDEFQKLKREAPAEQIGAHINSILSLAPSAGLYIGIKVQPASTPEAS
jgi:hypothetical protein